MPSDSKKKKEAAKKEIRKKKDIKKPNNAAATAQQDEEDVDVDDLDQSVSEKVETTNGDSENLAPMAAPTKATNGGPMKKVLSHASKMAELDKKLDALHLVEKVNADNRSCTGKLNKFD